MLLVWTHWDEFWVEYVSAGGDKKADVGAGANESFQFVSTLFFELVTTT